MKYKYSKILFRSIKYLLFQIFLFTNVIYAADLVKMSSQLARGSVTISDAGQLTLTSSRYFQNVNYELFPAEDASALILGYTSTGVMEFCDWIYLSYGNYPAESINISRKFSI
jgi:hypothetical protein